MTSDEAMAMLSEASFSDKASLQERGLKNFLSLAGEWKLSSAQHRKLLGDTGHAAICALLQSDYKNIDGFVSDELIVRLSHIARIGQKIQHRYPELYWKTVLHIPITKFSGRSIVDVMIRGNQGLERALKYLDGPQELGALWPPIQQPPELSM
jgi:hypothetical protein